MRTCLAAGRQLLATLVLGALCGAGTAGHADEPPPEEAPATAEDAEEAPVELAVLEDDFTGPLTRLDWGAQRNGWRQGGRGRGKRSTKRRASDSGPQRG